jgi:hypothetical protein
MYARIEAYPVMGQVHLAAVILEEAQSPAGQSWDPVWACKIDVPVSPTGEAVDDLWQVIVALAEQLEAATAALR